MRKAWGRIVTRVSGIVLSAVVMAGVIGSDTALAVEKTYTVKEGDTLTEIAQEQYGFADWWEVLCEINSIKDPNLITVGQELTIMADSSALVEQSDCSVLMLLKYLSSNRVESAERQNFLTEGTWPEGLSVPADDDVLAADGRINWDKAPQNGYTLDADGNAKKKIYVPRQNEVLDRYGSAQGSYTSPVGVNGQYSYEARSLPYVEDQSSYHRYVVEGDISKLEDYVADCGVYDKQTASLVEQIRDQKYDGDYKNMVVYRGEVASAFGRAGGGIQYEFPISIDLLCKLHILREDTQSSEK